MVTHDERLIRETESILWVVEDKGCFEVLTLTSSY